MRLRSIIAVGVLVLAPHGHAAPAHETIDVAAAPNGILWDAPTSSLYIADESSGSVVVWHDNGAAASAPIALPAGSKPGLGQVLLLGDGTLVVARFGHGESGAVVVVPPKGGGVRVVSGLDTKRRRVGLAPGPDGGIYSAWFEKIGEHENGGVSLVSLAGGERDVATGLGKLVGLATSGEFLYLGDQSAGTILRCSARACAHPDTLAQVAAPDLLAPGPDGAVLAASRKGGVTLVCPDGHTRSVVPGDVATRGVAFDAKKDRLFVVEHGNSKSVLRIVSAHLGGQPCKTKP